MRGGARALAGRWLPGLEGVMADLKMNREKLLDKLCERWLFEKKTVDLYGSIIEKLQGGEFGLKVDRLETFQSEEQEHYQMLEQYIKTIGGNTRRKTPSQMVVEQESQAFERIIADADDPSMLLHVLLDAEMSDNASWELLIKLATNAGQQDFVSKFAEARDQEKVHLREVRNMVSRLARIELIDQAQESP